MEMLFSGNSFELIRRIGIRVIASGVFLLPNGFLPAEASPASATPSLEIATFYAEISPPMGHPLCGGWIAPAEGFDGPELAKGVILKQGENVYVLCALDWCELRNDSYDLFRRRIAAAAQTSEERVLLSTVHQHNALLVDRGAQRLLDPVPEAPIHTDYDFLDATAGEIASAIRYGMNSMKPADGIGIGKAKVERVASSRRIPQPDGSVRVRFSSTKDEELRKAPEGKIDPWLRTVSFHHGNDTLCQIHFYATHPQSYYGDGRTNYDFPGIARERLEYESEVFQIYFTGCAGDIAAGKYNDGTKPRRRELADRLYEGMVRSVSSVVVHPVQPIRLKSVPVTFPLRTEEKYRKETYLGQLRSPETSPASRLQAALGLAWILRVEQNRPIDVTALDLGPVTILHLPGEPMVEFQLQAQRLAGDRFVAVAGYGDCGMGYICTAKAFEEGGYEPTASLVAPESEEILKSALARLLE